MENKTIKTICMLIIATSLASALYPGEVQTITFMDKFSSIDNITYETFGNTTAVNVVIFNEGANVTMPQEYKGSFNITFYVNGESIPTIVNVGSGGGGSGSKRIIIEDQMICGEYKPCVDGLSESVCSYPNNNNSFSLYKVCPIVLTKEEEVGKTQATPIEEDTSKILIVIISMILALAVILVIALEYKRGKQ
jgi:hypothetical protein